MLNFRQYFRGSTKALISLSQHCAVNFPSHACESGSSYHVIALISLLEASAIALESYRSCVGRFSRRNLYCAIDLCPIADTGPEGLDNFTSEVVCLLSTYQHNTLNVPPWTLRAYRLVCLSSPEYPLQGASCG